MPTAALIETRILTPSLDAQAHNETQARLICNPSADVDSLAEHLEAARRHCTPTGRAHLDRAIGMLYDLGHSNEAERASEREATGAADRLVSDLRRVERRPGGSGVLTAKGIARALRAPLERLAPGRLVTPKLLRDMRDVQRVCDQVPRDLLLSVTVRHELGVRKYTRLVELLEDGALR